MSEQTKLIRALNDQFRKGEGQVPGRIMMTIGVQELASDDPEMRLAAIVEAVQGFDTFTEDNDPYNEHDFGAFELYGEKLFWKLDYYAPDMLHGSEDPAEISKTIRVLTIMLASEY
jgi:hypothetical protein